MRTKGISLPIETIVIIAVAVLVLVVVTVFFVGGSGKQISSITDSQHLQPDACNFLCNTDAILPM